LAVVVLTLIAFLILGGFEAWRDSATFDEPVYVSSGVAAILHHDLADNAEHPPLFKVLAALPVLAVGPVVPADGHWNVNNERTYSARFVEAQIRAGTMHRVTFASRLVPLLECGLLALALYGLAALLFGVWSGVVAALLWLLDPVVLGLGHLDGVDLPFALTTVLVSWALVRWLRKRDGRSLVWLGVACGAAVSAQTTGILVGAVAVGVVVVAAVRSGQRGWQLWRQPVSVVLVAWVLVWAVYIALDPGIVVHSWVILPQPYVEGLKFLATNDTGSSPGFLLGVSWTGASVWFWPATLLVKLSTPVLVLLLAGPLALVALVRSGRISRSTWHQTVVAVILPALVLFVFELPNPRTLGVAWRSWRSECCSPPLPPSPRPRSRTRSPIRPRRSDPATEWPRTPTWTGDRTSRSWPPGVGVDIPMWRTSVPVASPAPISPGPVRWSAWRPPGFRAGWRRPPVT
jgi:hypothetical protein